MGVSAGDNEAGPTISGHSNIEIRTAPEIMKQSPHGCEVALASKDEARLVRANSVK